MEGAHRAIPRVRPDGRRPRGKRHGHGAQVPVQRLRPDDGLHGRCERRGKRSGYAQQCGVVGQSEHGGRLYLQLAAVDGQTERDCVRKGEQKKSPMGNLYINTHNVQWNEC